MPVEEVHVPLKVTNIDPKGVEPHKTEPSYYEKKVQEARAKREFIEEQRMLERAASPEAAPEPPFQIKGSVNIGDFDFQRERQEREQLIADERLKTEERIRTMERERDELRQQTVNMQLAQQREVMQRELQELKNMIAGQKQPSFLEQISAISQLAESLGYSKVVPGSSDAQTSLELKKLDLQIRREEERWKRETAIDERNYQLELKKIDLLAGETLAKLNQEKEKLDTLKSLPTALGTIFAKGIMDGAKNQSQPSRQPSSAKNYSAEAAIGESGVILCPNCKTDVMIGPTASRAVCASCKSVISINRQGPTPPRSQHVPQHETLPDLVDEDDEE